MKNLSLILNGVLFVAVIILYVLHFTGSKTESSDPKISTSGGNDMSTSSIVYINEDSLLSRYDFFKIESARLEGKRAQSMQDYEGRASGLQAEIENFQRTASNMTINQARAIEEDLMRKQQNLVQYEQTLSQNLMQENNRLNQQLYEKVSEFLKGYAAENNYNIVLTFRRGNALMYADEGMDITREVITKLNEAYAKGDKAEAIGTITE